MQKMDRIISKKHLIDFSSFGSSDELDVLRKENEEGILSRKVLASSNIGVLPSHRRPSLFAGILTFRGPDVEPVVNVTPIGSHTCTPRSMWRIIPVTRRSSRKPLLWIWRSTAISGMIGEKSEFLPNWMCFLLYHNSFPTNSSTQQFK